MVSSLPSNSADYSALIQELRAAVARDFPERSNNIWIMDETQPLDTQLEGAAHFLGFAGGSELYDILEALGRDVRESMGAISDYKIANGITIPISRADGSSAIIVFAGGYKQPHPLAESFPTGENLVDQIRTLLHETGHAIHLTDPDFSLENLNRDQYSPEIENLVETFAETFAYDVGYRNGLFSRRDVDRFMAERDSQLQYGDYGTSGLTAYNASDEFSVLLSRYANRHFPTYNGNIQSLRASYETVMPVVRQQSQAAEQMAQIPRLNNVIDTVAAKKRLELAPVSESREVALEKEIARLSYPYFQQPQIFPHVPRVLNALEYLLSLERGEDPGFYSPIPVGMPNFNRAAAVAWIARNEKDSTQVMLSDTFLYELSQPFVQNQSITEAQQQKLIRHEENNVWAEELLAGTDIITALSRGLESIERGESADQPSLSAPPLFQR